MAHTTAPMLKPASPIACALIALVQRIDRLTENVGILKVEAK